MKNLPRIVKTRNSFSFLVGEQPYIILGAEVHNSACSSREYMKTVWEKAVELNCNTVLVPIYWETIEPRENQYDYSMVEDLIADARAVGKNLILLWFGSWKNGCSTYVPQWIKTDFKRFPRVEDEHGIKTKILSMFQSDILAIETKSFSNFMNFLVKYDFLEQTVIAVQVENEVGVLGVKKDFSVGAENEYNKGIPDKLWNGLKKIESTYTKLFIESNDVRSWDNVFKEYAEEAFMSWNYANHINVLVESGKKYYNLPMFTNAWQKEFEDEKPGVFPCGGPLPEVLDIWKIGAPSLEILSPDIYSFDFKKTATRYSRDDNPLFIAETRRDKWAVANLYLAVGSYHAICYSPFGLESIGENKSFITQKIHTDSSDKNISSEIIKEYLAESYKVFEYMMPIITKYYGTKNMIGFAQDEHHMNEYINVGEYRFTINYYHHISDDNEFIPGAGIIIKCDNNEFIFLGYGYKAIAETMKVGKQTDFLFLKKGTYDKNASWNEYMFLNGDEQHIQMEEKITILRATFYDI